MTKSQKLTNRAGGVTATIEMEPWGSEVARSSYQTRQPQRYTSYIRDGNGHDEAMHRRYQAGRSRFFQPDPYDGSMSLADPQSFNRYAYVNNDPVNRTDPTGLDDVCPDCWNTPDTPVVVDGPTSWAPSWRDLPMAGRSRSPAELMDQMVDTGADYSGGGDPGAPTTTPSPNDGGYDKARLAACIADVVLNLGAKSIPIVGGVYGAATEYLGAEISPLQWLSGTGSLYSSGQLDYASAAGNIARDVSRAEYNSRGGDAGLRRARDITSRTGRTSRNLQAKQLSNLKYLKVAKSFAKVIPGLSALLNAGDALADVNECFEKAKL